MPIFTVVPLPVRNSAADGEYRGGRARRQRLSEERGSVYQRPQPINARQVPIVILTQEGSHPQTVGYQEAWRVSGSDASQAQHDS
jgi:hypothetical protein